MANLRRGLERRRGEIKRELNRLPCMREFGRRREALARELALIDRQLWDLDELKMELEALERESELLERELAAVRSKAPGTIAAESEAGLRKAVQETGPPIREEAGAPHPRTVAPHREIPREPIRPREGAEVRGVEGTPLLEESVPLGGDWRLEAEAAEIEKFERRARKEVRRETGPDLIAVIREQGGIRPCRAFSPSVQCEIQRRNPGLIRRNAPMALDQMAEFLRREHPEFGIETAAQLEEALRGRLRGPGAGGRRAARLTGRARDGRGRRGRRGSRSDGRRPFPSPRRKGLYSQPPIRYDRTIGD